MDKIVYLFLGDTGVGKSEFCRVFSKHLGHVGPTPFTSSAGIASCTQDAVSLIVGSNKITDTPGLMDTKGRKKDIDNVTRIVAKVRNTFSECANRTRPVISH